MPNLLTSKSQVRGLNAQKLKLAALLVFVAPLAACSSGADRITASKIDVQDIRVRHPIEIAHGSANLSVIAEVHKGDIDERTRAQIRQFAAQYKNYGSGDIGIALPSGPGAGEARAALPGVRRALVAGGARGYIVVSTYPVTDPALASPIRLSYATIVARTRSRCGQWPNDLAAGSATEDWSNKAYWNFGCASQQMLAVQTADPRDLLGPDAETPANSHMRGRGIDAVRKGTDPGTSWKTENSNIGGVGN